MLPEEGAQRSQVTGKVVVVHIVPGRKSGPPHHWPDVRGTGTRAQESHTTRAELASRYPLSPTLVRRLTGIATLTYTLIAAWYYPHNRPFMIRLLKGFASSGRARNIAKQAFLILHLPSRAILCIRERTPEANWRTAKQQVRWALTICKCDMSQLQTHRAADRQRAIKAKIRTGGDEVLPGQRHRAGFRHRIHG